MAKRRYRIFGLALLLALAGCRAWPAPAGPSATAEKSPTATAGTAFPAPQQAVAQPASGSRYLVVSGFVNATQGTAQLDPLYVLTDAVPVEAPTEGDYTLQLLGAGDTVLAAYPIPHAELADVYTGTDEVHLIGQRVPWVEGVQRVVLLSGATELASVPVSLHAPRVTVLAPNGGETLTEASATVSWQGADDDGDTLHYVLQYSADGGQTWLEVGTAEGTTTPETLTYTLELGALPGGEQALIRVIASDGINTTSDVSDGTFSVPQSPPQPLIDRPYGPTTILPQDQLTLEGRARDLEDGTLPGSALAWRSDVDGPLGAGESVTHSGWTAGVHTLTLTATDSDGLTASASVTITVRPDADGDAMPDDWETLYGLDPSADDSLADLDGDLLINRDEYHAGTRPDNPDTDGDGFPDGLEAAVGANPTQAGDPTTQVRLQFSGAIRYRADRWRTFDKPAQAMLPFPRYPFTFDDHPIQMAVGGAELAESIVVLRLVDSNGRGLAGGTAEYYDNGWQPIQGTTDVNGDLVCIIPGIRPSLTFRMTYEGTSQEKTQDVASDSCVVFRTQSVDSGR